MINIDRVKDNIITNIQINKSIVRILSKRKPYKVTIVFTKKDKKAVSDHCIMEYLIVVLTTYPVTNHCWCIFIFFLVS
jgi:hypothetical protein